MTPMISAELNDNSAKTSCFFFHVPTDGWNIVYLLRLSVCSERSERDNEDIILYIYVATRLEFRIH